MLRSLLKSKIHRATVTEANLLYVGSLSLDEELMKAADLKEYEEVMVANIANGARLTTYAITAPAGSGTVGANGAAARLLGVGDEIIVFSFADYDEVEVEAHEPRLVFVDRANHRVPGPARERHAEIVG